MIRRPRFLGWHHHVSAVLCCHASSLPNVCGIPFGPKAAGRRRAVARGLSVTSLTASPACGSRSPVPSHAGCFVVLPVTLAAIPVRPLPVPPCPQAGGSELELARDHRHSGRHGPADCRTDDSPLQGGEHGPAERRRGPASTASARATRRIRRCHLESPAHERHRKENPTWPTVAA
jgi:hypothetical protein